jgi:hypothetical protein
MVGVPIGNQSWQVSAVYEPKGGGEPRAGSAFVTTSLTLVSRHYRVIATEIRVNGETVDSPMSDDGKGDEIYVAAFAQKLDRTQSNQLLYSYPVRVSSVHGDVSAGAVPQRVKAGTRSGNGGIQRGDVIRPVLGLPEPGASGFPEFVLFDGSLQEGRDELLLRPFLVEVDEPDYARARFVEEPCNELLCAWYRFLTKLGLRSMSAPAVKSALAGSQIAVVAGEQVWMTGSGYLVHIERQDQDRPIGLEIGSNAERNVGVVGMWRDKLIILSKEKIEAALASGRSTLEVRFWDHTALIGLPDGPAPALNGDYTLVMRIERVP